MSDEKGRIRDAVERRTADAKDHFVRQGMSSAAASRAAESQVRDAARTQQRRREEGSSRNKNRRTREAAPMPERRTGRVTVDFGGRIKKG